MGIGDIILELRKEHGISQQQAANAIGISQSTIAKIEIGRNEATASTIRKLADFFGVSSDFLLGRTDDLGTPLPSLSGDDYTEEERDLVSAYRELDPSLQKLLWNMIETWQKNTASEKETAKKRLK